MSRKLPETFDADNAIKRYIAGETSKEIAISMGVGSTTIFRLLEKRGIPRRHTRSRGRDEDIIARYTSGEPLSKIMSSMGTSYQRCIKVLQKAGIEIRPTWAYPKETAQAHAARRGQVATVKQLSYRAQCLEKIARERGYFCSRHETKMAALLNDRQISYIPQKAVGVYNLDFALTEAPIAVEVKAGGYTALRRAMLTKRMQDILDSGWWIVEVDLLGTKGAQRFIEEGAVDYVISFIDEVRRNPTALREYRVVRRDGQLVAVRSIQNNNRTTP